MSTASDSSDDQEGNHAPFRPALPRLLPASSSLSEELSRSAFGHPLAPNSASPSQPTTRTSPTYTVLPPKSKRTGVAPAACEPCRKRKSKCSAQRPKCHVCIQRGTDCVYTTVSQETHPQALKRKFDELQTRQAPYEELFDLLRSKSEKESLEVFRRIRNGGDVESILRHVKDGDLLMQMLVVPESHRQYQFPYVPEMPDYILSPDNPYLDSLIFDATTLGHTLPIGAALQRESRSVPYQCPYLKPYRAAEIVDGTLSQIDVSRWTRVLNENRLLRRLLHDFFLYQHPWSAFFHKDHVLEDMALGQSLFCSQLLVNSILAVACHISCEIPNRAHFWDPENLGYRFLAEAKRLWEIESLRRPNRLTTIQAALLLSVVSNTNGMDKIGTSFLEQAISMAQEEDLFAPDMNMQDEKVRRSRALTAWAIYSWQSSHCYSFLRAPYFSEPPRLPLPDSFVDPEFYAEIRIRYPPSQTVTPVHLGCIIKANFDFCTILNHIASRIFAGNKFHATAKQVLGYKDQLDTWFHNLPEPLSPIKLALPDHITIHIEYYGTLIKLFQSVLSDEDTEPESPAMDKVFRDVIKYSEIRLETLMRLHYLRHSFDEYSPRLMHWLIFLGNMAVEGLRANSKDVTGRTAHRPSSRTLRSTLILCAKGLYSQGQSYHLAVPVYRALRDRMKPSDVDLLRTYVTAKGDRDDSDQPLMMHYMESQWPVPIIKLNEDPKMGILERLVSNTAKMTLGTVSSESD